MRSQLAIQRGMVASEMRAGISYTQRLAGNLNPPSSKNYTTRYLLVAALAEGESILHYPALSEDAAAMERCLCQLGATIQEDLDDSKGRHLRVQGFGGKPKSPGVLNPGNAGAVLRLLMGVGSLLPEVRFETSYVESLGQRPHGDLLTALGQIGVDSDSHDGKLPIILRGGSRRGGKIQVSGARSSQFLSALLFTAPLLHDEVEIEVVDDLVSRPLVRTTLEVMREAGIDVEVAEDLMSFSVPGGQRYMPGEYTVNGDYPSAAAILAAGTVTGGEVLVDRLFEDRQGEREVVPLLQRFGVIVEYNGRSVRLGGHTGLRGTSFDGDTATDMVLAMVAVATMAKGETHFYNIGNLRLKECDRISVSVAELRAIGVDCHEGTTEILVRGCPEGYEGGMSVNTHHDHRVAQMLSIVGLRCRKGLTVHSAETVNKSYPSFYNDLIQLGARIELCD